MVAIDDKMQKQKETFCQPGLNRSWQKLANPALKFTIVIV